MGRRERIVAALIVAGAVAAGALVAASSTGSGDGAAAGACCFVNQAYTGVCRVVPSDGETCESILRYLNTPNSTGKSYCGGTTIRGGWRQVACQDD